MNEDKIYDLIFADNKKYKAFLFFAIIALICTLPYFGDSSFLVCEDMAFHFQRATEMAEGMRHGEWLPSLQEGNIKGMGYLVDVFYPSAFMYIPALMIFAGINPLIAMRIFIYLIHLSTGIVTFFSAKTVTKNTKFSFYLAAIYTLFPIRIINDTARGFLGQFLGAIFLPMVVLGTYHLLKNKRWEMLAIGMIGLVYTHLISVFLAAIFIALYLFVFNFKESMNKKTIVGLIKAAGTTLIIGIGFLVPFIDNMFSDNFKIDLNKEKTGIRVIDVTFGTFEIHWIVAIIIQVLLIIGLSKLKKIIERKEDKLFSLISVTIIYSVVMVTNLFPWELCEHIPMLGNIQFSFRILNIVTVFASVLITKLILSMKNMSTIFIGCFASMVMVLVVLPADTETLNVTKNIQWNQEDNSYLCIIGGEYMPIDLYDSLYNMMESKGEEDFYPETDKVIADGEKIEGSKEWHKLTFNTDKTYQLIRTDLTYYQGYKAYVNNKEVPVISTEGRVSIENAEPGNIEIKYEISNLQKTTAVISITAAIVFLILLIISSKKNCKKTENVI